jgi:type IV pilus assembly protein PilP
MTRNLLKNSYIVVQPTLILAVSLLFMGCDKKEEQTVASPAATSAAGAQQAVKPAFKPVSAPLRITPAPVNQFDFSSKKDPFKPFVAVKPETAPTKESLARNARAALPIHSFDISQFKLIGVVIGGRDNYAQVTDPNGKGYILKKGMAIGKNDGKVMAITSGGVDILEQFKDDNGRVRRENIKLTLPRKQ